MSIQKLSINMFSMQTLLLSGLWSIGTYASIVNIGFIAGVFFLFITCVLTLSQDRAGLIALILLFYIPAATLNMPNMFAVSTAVVFFMLIIKKNFVYSGVRSDKTKLIALVFFTLVVFGISMLSTPNIDKAIYYYKKYCEGFVFLLLAMTIIKNNEDVSEVINYWAIFAALGIVIKIVVFNLGASSYVYSVAQNLSVSDFSVEQRMSIYIEGSFAKRLLLPGDDPNYSSAGLVLPFAIALGNVVIARGWYKSLWVLCASSIAISIVGTFSRSGMLAVSVIIILMCLLRKKEIYFFAIISAGVLAAYSVVVPEILVRIFSIKGEVLGGGSGRYQLWQHAMSAWLDSPVFGLGLAGFYETIGEAAHNTYLQVLSETGLVGFLSFISVVLFPIRKYFSMPEANRGNREFSLLCGFIAFAYMIGTVTYQDIKLFWFAVGVMVCLFSRKDTGESYDCR